MNREITGHYIASFAAHISSEYQSQTWVILRERNKDVHVCVPYMTENSPEEWCHDSFLRVSPKVPRIVPHLVETQSLPNVIEKNQRHRSKVGVTLNNIRTFVSEKSVSYFYET